MFQSTNSGGSWRAAGLPNTNVQALAIDPSTRSTLYAGWGSDVGGLIRGGVYKSTDGGGSWSAVNTGLSYMYVDAVAIDPSTPSTLYAAGNYGSGVFQSTDGGGSWTAANTGLTNANVHALAIDPAPRARSTLGRTRRCFQSTDGGGSWTAIDAGLTDTSVDALGHRPDHPEHALRRDRWRRSVSEHRRRRQLERDHGPRHHLCAVIDP